MLRKIRIKLATNFFHNALACRTARYDANHLLFHFKKNNDVFQAQIQLQIAKLSILWDKLFVPSHPWDATLAGHALGESIMPVRQICH
jgi:hypothetical protein